MFSERAGALGAHLAEMDRMLRDVQAELAPERDPGPALDADAPQAAIPDPPAAAIPDPPVPAPPPPQPPPLPEPPPPPPVPEPPPPPPPPEPALDHQIGMLTELSERLVASMRELLDGYERVLAPAPRVIPEDGPHVTLSAGPFARIEALHEFEATLSQLRGVQEVTVREYEGTDRAIIDVRLA